MSLISWNCRGLGNPRTIKALQKVIQREEPILVFLMETKLNKEKIEKVYKNASGQRLNCAKTSLCFSTNTSREVQEEILERFGAQVIK